MAPQQEHTLQLRDLIGTLTDKDKALLMVQPALTVESDVEEVTSLGR